MQKKRIAVLAAGFVLILLTDLFSSFAFISSYGGNTYPVPVYVDNIVAYFAAKPFFGTDQVYTPELKRMRELRCLDLVCYGDENGKHKAESLAFLERFSKLEELDLYYPNAELMETLPVMPQVKELYLAANDGYDECADRVIPQDISSKLPNLENFLADIRSAKGLAGMENLRFLRMNGYGAPFSSFEYGAAETESLEGIDSMPRLEWLIVGPTIEGIDLTPLSACKELEALAIGLDSETDLQSALRNIKALPKLKNVRIDFSCEKIADSNIFAELKNTGNIETVAIRGAMSPDISVFAEYPSLNELSVSFSEHWTEDLTEERIEHCKAILTGQKEQLEQKGVKCEIYYHGDI